MENDHYANWVEDAEIRVNYSENGTTLDRTEGTSSKFYKSKYNNSETWRDASKEYCIEFDFSYTNRAGSTASIRFGDGNVEFKNLCNNAPTGSGHLLLKTNNGTLEPYLDGVHISAQDKTLSNTNGLQFQFYKSCSVTFKNLRVYYG